jgi:hypothetical protein
MVVNSGDCLAALKAVRRVARKVVLMVDSKVSHWAENLVAHWVAMKVVKTADSTADSTDSQMVGQKADPRVASKAELLAGYLAAWKVLC